MVLPDIQPVLRQYLALGFERVEDGHPGCVGLRAGKTYIILVSVALMEGDFRPKTVAPLVGSTIPYIHVRSLAAAKDRLESSAIIIEEAKTGEGTLEAIVIQHGQFMILAEKLE
ncbi:MAG: hypothetical protein H7Y60_13295 [Rhodospirillaceae bacterium]|nr:hypothetical protein [Rhodospirillales bacterium]